MRNDCNLCNGVEMIVTGTYTWILGEEFVEEDKWEVCPIYRGDGNGNNSCNTVSKKG